MSNSKNQSSESYTWKLRAFQQEGNLWLEWSTTADFALNSSGGFVRVYSGGEFPDNPADNLQTQIPPNPNSSPWDTGLRWGSGWPCAIIGEGWESNWEYVVQVLTDA